MCILWYRFSHQIRKRKILIAFVVTASLCINHVLLALSLCHIVHTAWSSQQYALQYMCFFIFIITVLFLLSGWLNDSTKTYILTYIVTGCFTLFSALMLLPLEIIRRRRLALPHIDQWPVVMLIHPDVT